MLQILLLMALGASGAQPAVDDAPRPSGRLFISPMGEPFRPQAGAADTFEAWFRQADGNGDGALAVAELQRDGDRFFTTLDVNRDGEIDPEEMARYEQEIAPEVQLGAGRFGQGGGDRERRDLSEPLSGRGADQRHGFGGPDDRRQRETRAPRARGGRAQGAGRFGLLNIPQPVARADTNLNRGVSTDEFRSAAAERFRLLDANRDGRLLHAELQALRPAGR
jgi:hypothetical protein